MGTGREELLVSDPRSELRLLTREKEKEKEKSAKIIVEGMSNQKKKKLRHLGDSAGCRFSAAIAVWQGTAESTPGRRCTFWGKRF